MKFSTVPVAQAAQAAAIVGIDGRVVEALSPNAYYPAVQGLRGFAALSVFCLHLYAMALHAAFMPSFPAALTAAWSTLGQGVPLFFIISGFVIPGSLIRHGDLNRFFIDRLLRIMPLFVVLHVIVFAVGPFVGYKWMRNIGLGHYVELFITNLTFTALPLGLPLAQQNSWTLTFEWAFYILIAATWLAFKHRASRVVTLPLLIILAVASCYYYPVCLYFGIGVLFARFPRSIRIKPVLELILVPISLVTFYFLAQDVNVAYAVLPATVLFLCVLQKDGPTARFLSTKPWQFLGLISYSLYLVHPIAVFPFQMAGGYLARHGTKPIMFFLPYIVLATATTMIASIAGYNLIEVRLRKSITSLWPSTRGAGKEQAPASR